MNTELPINTDALCELRIYTDTPWEATVDTDIMVPLDQVYDEKCSFDMMFKVLAEFEKNDEALVFVGSYEKCAQGVVYFTAHGIQTKILEV